MNRHRRFVLATIVSASLAAPALAQPPAQAPAAVAPNWLGRPTAGDVEHVYPPEALKTGLGGVARIQCKVTAAGTLDTCKVGREEPDGAGFGQAALQLAPLFKMTPQPALIGTTLTIPIRFGSTLVPALTWLRRPTPEAIAKVAPRSDMDAFVTLACGVGDFGRIEGCKVASETPANYGFGAAALKLASQFQLSRGGGTITIPVAFSKPR